MFDDVTVVNSPAMLVEHCSHGMVDVTVTVTGSQDSAVAEVCIAGVEVSGETRDAVVIQLPCVDGVEELTYEGGGTDWLCADWTKEAEEVDALTPEDEPEHLPPVLKVIFVQDC